MPHFDFPVDSHDYEFDEDDRDYQPYVCRHGLEFQCDDCDDEMADVYMDKCLNCGRIRDSKYLNEDQVCSKGCRNPNEY